MYTTRLVRGMLMGDRADRARGTRDVDRALAMPPDGQRARSVVRRRTHRRHRGRLRRITRFLRRHPVLLALLVVLLVGLEWGTYRLYVAYQAYQDVRTDVRALSAYTERDLISLSPEDLSQIERRCAALERDLARLNRATSVPLAPGLVSRLPWLGPRYVAGHDAIQLGRLLAPLGTQAAGIGREALAAYEAVGISAASASAAPTWLDVVAARRRDIEYVSRGVSQARHLRGQIDDALLPGPARHNLADLDRLLARVDEQQLPEQLDALLAALGATRPARYLVLFPNPAEMRLAGGFPGDVALVELERGQLRSYAFFDIALLSKDYNARRASKVALPWPYEQYFRTDGFQIQDLVWIPDFAQLGAQFLAMYAESGWPPIDGVLAVQASVASDLLRVVGPELSIDVDGEARTITPENLYAEIERQRTRRLAGETDVTSHKVVLATIGAEIIERLKSADRGQLRQAATLLRAGAERRDIQVYAADPAVEGWLDERRWSGRMVPDPATPTIAVVFGDLVGKKASLRVQPQMTLTVGPSQDGYREARLDVYVTHTGTSDESEFYAGFQRWWTEIYLPEGAERLWTHDQPQPDPAAPNGGSYLIELFPGQSGYASVTFRFPDTTRVLLRRQPGITPVDLTVRGCAERVQQPLTHDVTLRLLPSCAGTGQEPPLARRIGAGGHATATNRGSPTRTR